MQGAGGRFQHGGGIGLGLRDGRAAPFGPGHARVVQQIPHRVADRDAERRLAVAFRLSGQIGHGAQDAGMMQHIGLSGHVGFSFRQ